MSQARATIDRHGSGLVDRALAGEVADLYHPLTLGLDPKGPPEHQRQELSEALAANNNRWHHPRAEELAEALAEPKTKVIVSGQQPGILGGPFYTVIKALTASLLAEQLRQAGQPAVAVFWIAGEDHDFREVSSTAWLQGGGLETETLGDDPSPLLPVGQRSLGPEIEALIERWSQASQAGYWLQEAERVSRFYHTGATYTDAFASYLISVLGDRCPLLLDSQDTVVKRLEQPYVRALIDGRDELAKQMADQDRKIQDLGYTPQVRSRVGTAPLFLHHQGYRKRIFWRNEGFALDETGDVQRIDTLLAALEEDPRALSPSALARPAIQDALLGTSLFVVGPGEMAYMAQASVLYPLLGVTPPSLALRPSVAVGTGRKLDQLAAADFPMEALLAGSEEVELALSRLSGTNPVVEAKGEVMEALKQLEHPLSQLQSDLANGLAKTQVSIAKNIERLEARVDRVLAEQDQTKATRGREMQQILKPDGKPQERVLSTACMLGRFGPQLVDELAGVLDLRPGRMQLVAV